MSFLADFQAVKAVMQIIDEDGEGTVDVMELAEKIDESRRLRREFAGNTLHELLMTLNRRKMSILRQDTASALCFCCLRG